MSIRGILSSLGASAERNVRGVAVAVGLLLAVAAIAPAAVAAPQEVSMTVQLSDPLSLGDAHEGEEIRAQILSPDSFKGDVIKGKVTLVKASHGQQVVEFQFYSLHHGENDYVVMANLQTLTNSKGQQGMDEQGRPLRTTTIPGKEKGPSKFGGTLGGIVGAHPGGGAIGSEAPPPSIQVIAPATDSSLATGATMKLAVRANGGGDLTGLYPNRAEGEDPSGEPVSAAPSSISAGAPPIGAAQPDLKSAAIEFIPGEKTIFFDDFSDMQASDAQSRWKLRSGKVDLRKSGDVPELYAPEDAGLISPSLVVPSNFTFELEWTGSGQMEWIFRNGKTIVLTALLRGAPDGASAILQLLGSSGATLGSGQIVTDSSKVNEFALWAQQHRMSVYLNGQRVADVDEFQFAAINHFDEVETKFKQVGLRKVCVAESAPDFSTEINASGKYVTHGISFDPESDRLKLESAATMKEIASALAKNPNLKLEINVYSDATGYADHNLELSKRRAQAVMSVLVTQLGIDAARLTANGFGAAKPLGSNQTAEGRTENGRVEFIRK